MKNRSKIKIKLIVKSLQQIASAIMLLLSILVITHITFGFVEVKDAIYLLMKIALVIILVYLFLEKRITHKNLEYENKKLPSEPLLLATMFLIFCSFLLFKTLQRSSVVILNKKYIIKFPKSFMPMTLLIVLLFFIVNFYLILLESKNLINESYLKKKGLTKKSFP